MNKLLEIKLTNVLKAEAMKVLESKEDDQERLSRMNDIDNMMKIIQNYDELEPVLQKYFAEKHNKEKWEGR
jgi:hypothetical protein